MKNFKKFILASLITAVTLFSNSSFSQSPQSSSTISSEDQLYADLEFNQKTIEILKQYKKNIQVVKTSRGNDFNFTFNNGKKFTLTADIYGKGCEVCGIVSFEEVVNNRYLLSLHVGDEIAHYEILDLNTGANLSAANIVSSPNKDDTFLTTDGEGDDHDNAIELLKINPDGAKTVIFNKKFKSSFITLQSWKDAEEIRICEFPASFDFRPKEDYMCESESSSKDPKAPKAVLLKYNKETSKWEIRNSKENFVYKPPVY